MTEPAALTLATSHDGQWAVARQDRALALLPGAGGAPVARVELGSADADIAFVGPPTALIVVSRDPNARGITLYTAPQLEAAARLDLDTDAKLLAVSAARVAVGTTDGKHVAIVRSAGRALATHKVEIAGPLEFVVGLERNQMLFGLAKKLEVWDATAGRPLLRAQFQLPPAPRVLGAAAGHLWAMSTGSDEILLYRLSDGRPFRHDAGAAITCVVCHPASPIVVLVTPKGLLRLHAYAHSLTPIEGVPKLPAAFALHAVGDDISLVGFTGFDRDPWRIPINGAGAAQITSAAVAGASAPVPAADSAGAPRAGNRRWREPLAAYAAELAKGTEGETPAIAIDSELGELAQRLNLSAPARRALTALYALHLIGETITIAALAKAINDWPEALGQGDLGALAMLRRKHGRVGLRTAVVDVLDGVPPRSVRLVGGGSTTPHAGAFRISRDSRSDAEVESALAAQLGRIAVASGSLSAALLEARLHGATAIAYSVPTERPRPWPRDAGLVFVLYGTNASWIADLPPLPTTAS
jgi:hypothetical protein